MYLSQSEIIRELLSKIFKQKDNVEESELPIYVNYSIPYYEIDKSRIIIYNVDSLSPENFLGNEDILRTQGFSIVVSDKDDKVAFDRQNQIMDYLEHCGSFDDVIDIDAVSDIEPMGINPKKYYLYRCDYLIKRIK